MEVSGSHKRNILETYARELVPGKRPEGRCDQLDSSVRGQRLRVSDTISLSPNVKKAKDLETYIKGLPEVRTRHIQRLVSSVGKGQYSVDPEEVAEGILSETLKY